MTADHVTIFFHALTSQSFRPLITLPTRFSATRVTLIDKMFCRNSETMLSTTSVILIDKFSDHQPYFTTINWKTYEKLPKYIKICKQTSADIDKFRIDLNKSNILENIDLNADANPNTNYEALDGIIENARLQNFPGKTVKLNKYKHKKCNRITQGILKSIKFKKKLYKDMKLSTPQSPQFETLKTNLNNYNKILRHNIRLAKQKYFQTSFINCNQNIKNTWSIINDVLNETKNKKDFPDFFEINEENVTDKVTIANEFNLFFTGIGPLISVRYILGYFSRGIKMYL